MARSFLGALNSIAREAARQRRQAEAEQRRQQRVHLQYERQLERTQRLRNKEEKQRYLEQRIGETEDANAELAERLQSLREVLNHTLSIDDTIKFDALRMSEQFKPAPTPHELSVGPKPPRMQDFIAKVKAPGFLEKAFGLKKRYESELAAAKSQYEQARSAHAKAVKEREEKLAQFLAEQEKSRQSFIAKV